MEGTDRYRLELRSPAACWKNKWRDALPTGNGTIGAAVYGGIRDETILLNHTHLWQAGVRMPLPDVSHALPAARALMAEANYAAANRLLSDTLRDAGYRPELPTPLPLGDLQIAMPVETGFRHYRRVLNMETGEVTVGWTDGACRKIRRLFVSRAHGLVVCEITAADVCGNPVAITAAVGLAPHDPRDTWRPPFPGLLDSAEVVAAGEFIRYAARNDDGTDFGAVCRVIAAQGSAAAEGNKLSIAGEGQILLLVKPFVSGDRRRSWPTLCAELAAVDADYAGLLQAHVRLHRPLFLSAGLRLTDDNGPAADAGSGRSNEELLQEAYDGAAGNRLIEKMWAFGRYLLLSGTGDEANPLALYGLWCGDYAPMWSQYVANQNVQMMLWHAPVGGMAGQMRSLFAYCERLLPQFRDNARKLFGARGIYIPAYTAPGHGAPAVLAPVIANWTGAAGWLSREFYMYALYTDDTTFLRERALPFMREAALFYADFLIVGPDGYYRSLPSVSPENTPANFLDPAAGHLDHPMPSAINATMDFAIAKELLGNLVRGSRRAGVYAEEIPGWEEMLRRIPSYAINDDGALREWMDPAFDDNYNHRHAAHLYPLFPGTEISAEREPQWFAACRTAVGKRRVVGLGDQSGWSLTQLANLYARLGEGDAALECLNLLAQSCVLPNFYTVHNDWRGMGVTLPFPEAPVQLDANMGLVSAVQEMLLYASETEIRLLPALPSGWEAGDAEGLRFYAGTVRLRWDRRTSSFTATIAAERAATIGVQWPAWPAATEWEAEGGAEAYAEGADRIAVRLSAAGQRLHIRCRPVQVRDNFDRKEMNKT